MFFLSCAFSVLSHHNIGLFAVRRTMKNSDLPALMPVSETESSHLARIMPLSTWNKKDTSSSSQVQTRNAKTLSKLCAIMLITFRYTYNLLWCYQAFSCIVQVSNQVLCYRNRIYTSQSLHMVPIRKVRGSLLLIMLLIWILSFSLAKNSFKLYCADIISFISFNN